MKPRYDRSHTSALQRNLLRSRMSSRTSSPTSATASEKLLEEVVHCELSTLKVKLDDLLLQGADPNWQDRTGKTALHLLLSDRRDEPTRVNLRKLVICMEALLDGGASVDMKDWEGQTVVYVAASMNVPSQILTPIIKKCNISELSADVIRELMLTDNLDVNVLTVICQLGVDLTLSDKDNVIATYHMVEKHRAADALLVQTLAHERPEDFSEIKDGLVFHTCLHGSKEALEALLELGAQWSGRDVQSGLPALLMAASSIDSEEAVAKVDILLADEADIHMPSSSGQNLCHIAALQRNTTILRKALLARVNHTRRDSEGNTPLHYACAVADNNNMVITLLVDAGLDINETNSEGNTPLLHALASNHADNIIPLIKAGVSIENSNLAAGLYRDLQMLAQPEVIKASSRPLEFALSLSSFYEQMACNKPRLKEGYMELSTEMENVAIDMVDGLQATQTQRLALNGPVVEKALSTSRKRFVANEAVQQELYRVWEGNQEKSYMGYALSLLFFFIQIIARPLVIIVIWPLIAFNIKLVRYSLSWDILYPCAPPIVWYYADALSYYVFVFLLLVGAFTLQFTERSVHAVEWLILFYLLGFIHNELQSLWREGFHFYFSTLGRKRFAIALILFIVFFAVRFAGIYGNMSSSSTVLRVSNHILAPPTLLAGTRLLQYLRVHPKLGPIQGSFSKLQQESLLFLVILSIYLVAFATALANVYGATRFAEVNETATGDVQCPAIDSISEAGISLFWSLFGLLDLQDLNNCTSLEQTFGKVLVAVWLVLAVIILLNMLIALVTNKFQEVQSNADVEWKFSVGIAILQIQQSHRIPAPFNLLHTLIDFLEWLFMRGSLARKGNFSLAQVPSTLQSKMQEVQAGDVQIETFRQAEEKRALVQAVTKGDLTDVNKRLQEMEASLGSVCQVMKVEQSSSRLPSIDEADGWIRYRRRLRKLSDQCEQVEEKMKDTGLTGKKGVWHKKTLLHKMLPNKDATSTGGERKRLEQHPLQSHVNQADSVGVTSQSSLIQVLASLQRSVQQQGETIQHIRTKLAYMEIQLEGHENSAGNDHQLLLLDEDAV